jgi:hypothetical protein
MPTGRVRGRPGWLLRQCRSGQLGDDGNISVMARGIAEQSATPSARAAPMYIRVRKAEVF